MKNRLFLNLTFWGIFFLCSFSVVFCQKEQQLAFDFNFQDLLKDFGINLIEKEEDGEQNEESKRDDKIEKISNEASQNFQTHISKYFPKVFVAREKFFSNMTPEDISKGLQDVVDMIADTPWIYVEMVFKSIGKSLKKEEQNTWKDKGFNLDYLLKIFKDNNLKKSLKSGLGKWEFIADQLAFYSEFVERARIRSDGTVFVEEFNYYSSDYFWGRNKKNNCEKLKDYWNKKGIIVHYNLYALCFDYWVKLFLEGILNKDLSQSYKYYDDLRIIMERLEGSKYESQRRENMKTYKELLELLKQKVRPKKNDGGDKYTNEVMEFYDMD